MIGIIDINGTLGPEKYLQIEKELNDAILDHETKKIVLFVNSTGGDSTGVYTLADKIFTSPKPVYSFIGNYALSAGYWLASQAKQVYGSRGCFSGSVGVYMFLVDDTGQQEKAGIKTILVGTSPEKTAMVSGPVDETAKQCATEEIQQIESIFHADILRARPQVKIDDVKSGKSYQSPKALELGLIDGVMPFEEFIFKLISNEV